ncbi:MAG: aldehyde dehydrogenase family protein, partial [Myxococcota bacterium]
MTRNTGNGFTNKIDSTVQSINGLPPIVVKSPLDGSVLGEVRSWTVEEAVQAAVTAKKAQSRWAESPFSQRRAIIQRWLNLLNDRSDEFSRALAAENGKTVYEAYMMEIISIMLLAKY